MDWDRAIARNTAALEAVAAALFALLGLSGGEAPARISRALHAQALRLLRPAESALRRLIVIAARGLVAKPAAKRPAPPGLAIVAKGQGRASFRLFDPRKRFGLCKRAGPKREPRIHFFGTGPLVPILQPAPRFPAQTSPEPDGLVSALPLRHRLQAMKAALADLPRQARRLARWRARRAALPHPTFTCSLRPGRPPGSRRIPIHEVDRVLTECHGLAWDALRLNSS